MIHFSVVRYKNLLSSGNIFTEVQLDGKPKTLIVGDNGAGKSTVIEAISFALFNKPYRSINKGNLVNSINQKGMLVEIEFKIGKKQFKVVRGVKPNVFEIYQNGKLLNQNAENKDYQEFLERQILKCNHKTFCQVVILGTASFIPFMQLPANQRREIVEDILDLKIFSIMNLLLKNRIVENDVDVYDTNAQKKLLTEKIRLIAEHHSKLKSTVDKQVAEKQARITDSIKAITKADTQIADCKYQIDQLLPQFEQLPKLRSYKNKLEQYSAMLVMKKGKAEKAISFYESNDTCPTCAQLMDPAFKQTSMNKRKANIEKIDAMMETVKKSVDKASKKVDKAIEAEKAHRDLLFEISRLEAEVSNQNSYIEDLQSEIDSLSGDQTIGDNENQLKETQAELVVVEQQYKDLLDRKQMLNSALLLLRDGGIKSKIIKQYVPIINKLINKYLSEMDFFVQFSLDENFDEKILSRHRDNFKYSSFSEGEKFRINLAILFTWRTIAALRNSINTNILILDEVMDSSLDATGVDEFLKIINAVTSSKQNLFVISHKVDQMYDKFDSVLKFEKHNNFSKMKEI